MRLSSRSVSSLRALVLFLLIVWPASVGAQPRRVIIDTDPGTDDAMAILLALNSPELRVDAMTVVPGNVTGAQALENALALMGLAGRCDVPIAAGAQRPLAQKLITAEFVHGRDGMGNIAVPGMPCRADARFAPDLIIELVRKAPGQITLLPIGPLTNIALAVLKDPGIVPLVRDVVIMGGSITEGNVTAVAEANVYNDPEAAHIVFTAGWKVTMVGLDVTHRTLFGQNHLAELRKTRGTQNDFASQVMAFLVELSAKFGSPGTPMHDPLAVGVAVDPTLVTVRDMRVDVETRGQFTRGMTVGNRNGAVERNVDQGDRVVMIGIDPVAPNASVAVQVEADRFLKLFIERLRAH